MKTAESVRDFGVLTPAIVRPDPYGGYEIISGHRRHRASELAGKETMPVIVREMDDDAAIILMVDANLQRETILPSERAYAYKMKLDAIKHQGQRSDLTSGQVVQKLWSVEKVAEGTGESYKNVQRYIRLTELMLRSPEIANILENSDFIYMLNQASDDRNILAQRLNISPHQLSYVTNSGEGEGLLFYGNVILPFVDRFPTDLELYRIMTTKLSEVQDEKEV